MKRSTRSSTALLSFLIFCFTIYQAVAVTMKPSDAQALRDLNAAFEVFRTFPSWNASSTAVCDGEPGAWEGITCNANGRVTAISPGVPVRGGFGIVPDSFGNLTALETWSWSYVILEPLPTTIAQLTNLQRIDLGNCELEGGFPSFRNFPKLINVILQYNSFDPALFPLNTITSLPNLKILDLEEAFDRGVRVSLPSFTNLPSLLYLDLSVNNFTGSIPADFLRGSIQIAGVSLSYNELTGPLPSLKASNRWVEIDLEQNQFEGSIPTNWKDFDNLTALYVDNNQLSGVIPRLPRTLTEFNAESNWLTGNVSQLLSLPNLVDCKISSNLFDTCPGNFALCCNNYQDNPDPPPPTTATLSTATLSATSPSSSATRAATTATTSDSNIRHVDVGLVFSLIFLSLFVL